MGPGPIPWRDVAAFADRAGMIPAQFEAFDLAIAALDHAYLEWVVAERERERRAREEASRNKP